MIKSKQARELVIPLRRNSMKGQFFSVLKVKNTQLVKERSCCHGIEIVWFKWNELQRLFTQVVMCDSSHLAIQRNLRYAPSSCLCRLSFHMCGLSFRICKVLYHLSALPYRVCRLSLASQPPWLEYKEKKLRMSFGKELLKM